MIRSNLDSALWNLSLYTLPTSRELAPKGGDIPYRYCPHIEPEGRFYYFCLLHIAYMCKQCADLHRCRLWDDRP